MIKVGMTIFGVVIGLIVAWFFLARLFQNQPIFGWIWGILGAAGFLWPFLGWIQKYRNKPTENNSIDNNSTK